MTTRRIHCINAALVLKMPGRRKKVEVESSDAVVERAPRRSHIRTLEVDRERARIRVALHLLVSEFDAVQISLGVDLQLWKDMTRRDYALILALPEQADLNAILNAMRELGFNGTDIDYLFAPIEPIKRRVKKV